MTSSTGVGSSSHLDTELLAAATGIVLHHVPYRGSGQTVAAISTEEVQVLIASVTAAQGAVESGRVRALAVLSSRRSPLLPLVPTIAEAGLPALDVRTWLGVVAPAGTPRAVVDELDRVVGRVMAAASVPISAQATLPAWRNLRAGPGTLAGNRAGAYRRSRSFECLRP